MTLKTCEVYDPNTNTWSDFASMHTARGGFGVAIIDDRIYAIGTRTYFDSFRFPPDYYYDSHFSFFSMFAAGGRNSADGFISSVERYDAANDKWVFVTPLPMPCSHFGLVVIKRTSTVINTAASPCAND